MMRLQVTENYTVNSKGESVPIHEVAGEMKMMCLHIYIYSLRPVMEELISVRRVIHYGLIM